MSPLQRNSKADPWTSRYVSGSFSADGADSSALQTATPLRRSTSTLATNRGLGLGIASSVNRDLRSSAQATSGGTSPPFERKDIQSTDRLNEPSAPLIAAHDGIIKKVVGTLLQPESSPKWACAACEAVFARDATIFAAPASATSQAEPVVATYYCRECYVDRFALGFCASSDCGKAVLGSTKEDGKFVRADKALWHGRCWRCIWCNKGGGAPPLGDGEEVMLGMSGQPTCEGCFEKSVRPRSDVPTLREIQSHASSYQSSVINSSGSSRGCAEPLTASNLRQAQLGAAIAELSRRFGTSLHSETSPVLSSQVGSALPLAPEIGSGFYHTAMRPRSMPKPAQGTIHGSGASPPAAFKAASGLLRTESRSRSASPIEHSPSGGASCIKEIVSDISLKGDSLLAGNGSACAGCGSAAFRAPPGSTSEAPTEMVTLRDGTFYHAACFRCAVCSQLIDAKSSFARLDTEFAHTGCAPPLVMRRPSEGQGDGSASRSAKSSRESFTHVTHQAAPRLSLSGTKYQYQTPITLYGALPEDLAAGKSTSAEQQRGNSPNRSSKTCPTETARRFQPSFGAAPPTRSAMNVRRRADEAPKAVNPSAGIFASSKALSPSLAASQRHRSEDGCKGTSPIPVARRFGGMDTCLGCGSQVTALERILGPRGTYWHRNCLVCGGTPPGRRKCGKKLDSAAKVLEGQIRCRDCFDRESKLLASSIVTPL